MASTEKGLKFAQNRCHHDCRHIPFHSFAEGSGVKRFRRGLLKKYILHTRHEHKESRVEYNQNHRHVWRHWRVVPREPAVAKGPLELLGSRLARVQFEVVPKVVAP